MPKIILSTGLFQSRGDNNSANTFKNIKTLLSLLLIGLVCDSAQALCPSATSAFQAYQADVNNDGQPDIVFVARPLVIVVPLGDNDDLLPLVLDPGLPPFRLLSVSGTNNYSSPLGGAVPLGAVPVQYKSTVLASQSGKCGLVFLRSATPGLPSILVSFEQSSAIAPTLLQIVTNADAGIDLARNDVRLVAQNFSGDAREDVKVFTGDTVFSVMTSDVNGLLHYDKSATLLAVWQEFSAAAARGDAVVAKQYLTAASQQRNESFFAQPADLAATFSNIVDSGVVETKDKYAMLVALKAPPESYIYELWFYFVDGTWRLDDF